MVKQNTNIACAPHADRESGFTLIEMMAALGILLFGVTAVLGALSSSIGQRRTTDARHALVTMCDLAMHRIQNEAIRSTNGDSSPFDLEFVPMIDQDVPGFPGMTWSATATADEDRPQLWLVKLEATWLDEGEPVVVEFLRVVRRQLPLRNRVLSFRGGSSESMR